MAAHALPAEKVNGKKLYSAAYEGNTDKILHLWRANSDRLDVEYKMIPNWTPLLWAAHKGHAGACRVLISTCCANINHRDCGGWTPLIVAAENNKVHCVEVLLELGADITPRDNVNNWTALEWARAKGHAEVVALLEWAATPMIKSALKV
jgi:ankyrin repeat protein